MHISKSCLRFSRSFPAPSVTLTPPLLGSMRNGKANPRIWLPTDIALAPESFGPVRRPGTRPRSCLGRINNITQPRSGGEESGGRRRQKLRQSRGMATIRDKMGHCLHGFFTSPTKTEFAFYVETRTRRFKSRGAVVPGISQRPAFPRCSAAFRSRAGFSRKANRVRGCRLIANSAWRLVE